VKAVVTGGAGFIGSHVVDALLAEGFEVHVVDNCSTGRLENLEDAFELGARLYVCDVTDGALDAVIGAVQPDVVLHLAAQIDVGRSVAEPSQDAVVNVAGTVAALEAARRGGARRFVLASTAAVYGDPNMLPTPEHQALAPISPYGAGKLAAEIYVSLYRRTGSISTIALRMANVYGPRQNPHGEAGVVAIFANAAMAGQPVTIFGDGEQTRDFVHVTDVAGAFVAATRSAVTGSVNVSSGREIAVRAVAERLGAEIRHGPPRRGDVTRSCLDPSAARLALGWKARMGLDEGLESLARQRSTSRQITDTTAVSHG
jgi:UDP-glucose 4-epimerase